MEDVSVADFFIGAWEDESFDEDVVDLWKGADVGGVHGDIGLRGNLLCVQFIEALEYISEVGKVLLRGPA